VFIELKEKLMRIEYFLNSVRKYSDIPLPEMCTNNGWTEVELDWYAASNNTLSVIYSLDDGEIAWAHLGPKENTKGDTPLGLFTVLTDNFRGVKLH